MLVVTSWVSPRLHKGSGRESLYYNSNNGSSDIFKKVYYWSKIIYDRVYNHLFWIQGRVNLECKITLFDLWPSKIVNSWFMFHITTNWKNFEWSILVQLIDETWGQSRRQLIPILSRSIPSDHLNCLFHISCYGRCVIYDLNSNIIRLRTITTTPSFKIGFRLWHKKFLLLIVIIGVKINKKFFTRFYFKFRFRVYSVYIKIYGGFQCSLRITIFF